MFKQIGKKFSIEFKVHLTCLIYVLVALSTRKSWGIFLDRRV